ncbi:SDR family NAD(P)-dependent oxidoreductase [Oceanobacillus timonensis]|uniref:SDR family NAD(P)-dependent oxidoreductase n=1 Tax=Oceanobacillus timonensis TaxID=1926285 RepID=UPI0009BBB0CE|nr:glucose 1-dehydrogenase [Oceanobacillus timonensis]
MTRSNIPSMFSLKGKTALIVGGSSGIGRETAITFAEAGADVIVADINEENAKSVYHEMTKLGIKSKVLKVDVADASSVEQMINDLLSSFDSIDILVNSAGINSRVPAENLSEEDWDNVIDINLKGTFLCCKCVAKIMMKQKEGNIINLASMSGMIVNKDRTISAYCSSKGGVIMLTKSLAVEWAKYNIRVNALAPGYVMTPINPWMRDRQINKPTIDLIPMQRFAEPSEISATALFLASGASSYMTGSVLTVDGGYTSY